MIGTHMPIRDAVMAGNHPYSCRKVSIVQIAGFRYLMPKSQFRLSTLKFYARRGWRQIYLNRDVYGGKQARNGKNVPTKDEIALKRRHQDYSLFMFHGTRGEVRREELFGTTTKTPDSYFPNPWGLGDRWYEEVAKIFNRGMGVGGLDTSGWSMGKWRRWKRSWKRSWVFDVMLERGAINQFPRYPPCAAQGLGDDEAAEVPAAESSI